MSRLVYKGDTINNFGRHLPVPYIERIEILNLDAGEVTTDAVSSFEDGTGTKLTLYVTLMFNTDDDFDETAFKEEIFSQLELNILLLTGTDTIQTLQDSKRELKNTIAVLKTATPTSPDLQYRLHDLNSSPDMITFTGDYDDDMNSVIRTSNIIVELETTRLENIQNLTVFVGTSVGDPDNFADSSDVAYAMNFSSLSYEHILKDYELATRDQIAFFTLDEEFYSGVPLRSVNKRYYKTEEFGPDDIKMELNGIMNNYRKYVDTDTELREAMQNIEFIYARYGEETSFLTELQRYSELFSNRDVTTPTGNLYVNFTTAIINANTLLLEQPEVVKRLVRTTKIRDLRPLQFTGGYEISYNPDLTSDDILYPDMLHTNLAKYVDVAGTEGEGGDLYPPFETEVPLSPSELEAEFTAALEYQWARLDGMKTGAFQETWSELEQRMRQGVFDKVDVAVRSLRGTLKTQTDLFFGSDAPFFVDYDSRLEGVLDESIKLFIGWGDNLSQVPTLQFGLDKAGLDEYFHNDGTPKGDLFRLHHGLYGDLGEQVGSIDEGYPDDSHEWAAYGSVPGHSDYSGATGFASQDGRFWSYRDDHNIFGAVVRTAQATRISDDGSSASEIEGMAYGIFDASFQLFYYETTEGEPLTFGSYPESEGYDEDLREQAQNLNEPDWPQVHAEACISGLLNAIPTPTDEREWNALRSLRHDLMFDRTADPFSLEPANTSNWTNQEPWWRDKTADYDMDDPSKRAEFAADLVDQMEERLLYGTDQLGGLLDRMTLRLRTGGHSTAWPLPDPSDASPTSPWSGVDSYVYGSGRRPCGANWYYLNKVFAPEPIYDTCDGPGNVAISLKEMVLAPYLEHWNTGWKTTVRSVVENVIELLHAYYGVELSTGRHKKLAETDIVVQKYGWYFFDMEKYIRHQSHLSRFLDVSKLINHFSFSKDMLNYSTRLAITRFQSTGAPEVDMSSGMLAINQPIILRLTADVSPASNVPSFESMSLKAIGDYWHMKIPALDVASWKDFVVDRDGAMANETGADRSTVTSSDIYAYLMMRNFDFPHDTPIPDDYRLMAFNYNYFVDDDEAIDWSEGDDEEASALVTIEDNSIAVLFALGDYLRGVYKEFLTYYILAIENCAFNSFDSVFNDFFSDYMNDLYAGRLEEAPWFKAPIVMSLYRDLFRNESRGDTFLIMEDARKRADNINPTTGYLEAVERFKSDLEEMVSEFEAIEARAAAAFEVSYSSYTPSWWPTWAGPPTFTTEVAPELTVRQTYVFGRYQFSLPSDSTKLGTIYGGVPSYDLSRPIIDFVGNYQDVIILPEDIVE